MGYSIDIYFGAPGSGKSTFAACLARKALKRGTPVYSNVEIKGCLKLDPRADIGKYNIHDGLVIIDEAGIDYNNRDFKSFKSEENKWFKLHRHYRCDVIVFSQSWEDMDKKIRLLGRNLFLIQKSLIPGLFFRRRISKRVGINDQSGDIVDEYRFVPWTRRYIIGRRYWKYFDSFVCPPLPDKHWDTY